MSGINYAIKSEYIDQNRILYDARVFEVVELREKLDFDIRCRYKSDNLGLNKLIEWKPVTQCSGHRIREEDVHS